MSLTEELRTFATTATSVGALYNATKLSEEGFDVLMAWTGPERVFGGAPFALGRQAMDDVAMFALFVAEAEDALA